MAQERNTPTSAPSLLGTGPEGPVSFIPESTGTGGSGSETQDNFDAALLAFIEGAAYEDDPLKNFDAAKDTAVTSGDTMELIRVKGEELGAVFLESAVGATIELAAPESGAAVMKETVDDLQGDEKEWRALELAVSATPDRIEQEQMAYEAAMYSVGKMMARSGALDTIGDWAGTIFFSSDALWDIDQFVREVGASSFESFVEQYNQLPPVEKLKYWKAIQKTAEDSFEGNQVKAANALLAILNPQADKDLSITGVSYAPFEKGFGALEAVGWITTVAATAKRMNAVRLAWALKNKKAAGAINKGALEGHPNAGVAGVTPETAAGNTLAFDMGKLDPSITKGVAPHTIEAIEAERTKLFEILKELQQTGIERAALKPIEQALAQQKALNKFTAWAADMEKKGWVIENARIGNADENGFEIFYDLANPEDIVMRPKPITVKYTFDDVGGYDSIEMGIGSTRILSPSRILEDIDPEAIGKAAAILPTQDKIIRIFDEAMKATWKPLSKQERKVVDDTLIKGDAQAKAFTIQELQQMGLNEKQVSAYYKARDLLDVLHAVKSKSVRDELAFKGWKSATVTNIGRNSGKTEVTMPVRQVGPGVLEERKIASVYDGTGSGTYWLSPDSVRFEKMLDNTDDYELVEFFRPVQVGDKHFTVGIVPKKKTSQLPINVLQKRPGYVPLIREGVFYAVKSVRQVTMDGRGQKLLKVERLFGDKAEADAFAAQFKGRNPDVEVKVLADSELTADDARELDIVNHGGLYGTPRTDKDILFGLDGVSADRISAVDAMARNMSHVANRLPMNQYRMGHVQRFLNSYGKYLERPWDWNSAFRADTPMAVSKGGESVRTFIKDLSRIPTPEEVVWGWHMRKIGELLQGKGYKKTGRYIMNLGHKDPWAAMRAASFYLQLGFFRLDQLFVQSAGASIAMSIHPILAPFAIKDYMAIRYAYALKDNPVAVRNIEILGGYKKGELVSMLNDWDRAGLMDAIRNNADYNAATLGLNIDAGMVSRITETGLLPFKEGELFAQGIGWMIARRKYMKERKLKGSLSNEDLDNVFAYSKAISLNLTRANRAQWQKGFWSLPTQFMQIQAKFFEQMMPAMTGGATTLDGWAKSRVWAGQIFLFGAAGVPFFKYALNSSLEAAGYNPQEASDEVKAWMAGGLAEFMTQATFGQRFDVSGRMSIPTGVEQLVKDLFVYDSPVTDTILGAFGSVPHRSFQAFRNTAHILKDPGAYEWNWDLVSTVGEEYAKVIASYNNYHRAKTWYAMGHITDNQGRVLADLDSETGTTLLVGKVLGFQPRLVTDYYDLKEWSTNLDKFNKQKVEAIRNLVMVHLSKNPADPVNQRNYDAMMAIITADIPSENDRKAVIREALAPLFEQETALNKMLKKYYKYAMDTGELDSINGTVSGSIGQSSVITTDDEDKK